jgi:hypothetical protein
MYEVLLVSVVHLCLKFISFSKDLLPSFLLSNHSAAQNGMCLPPTGFSAELFLGQSEKWLVNRGVKTLQNVQNFYPRRSENNGAGRSVK